MRDVPGTNKMGSQEAPLRILCLDGGGVKGLSSLYILKDLMRQIRRNNKSGSRQNAQSCLRPCDHFDLICGTGTGGLIAIMLGRLQYDIETAIKKYIALAAAVFQPSSTEDCAVFDAETLEVEMRKVIKAAPDGSSEDSIFEDARVTADTNICRTFVLASRPEGLGKAPVCMRTYPTSASDPFDAQIWQVARATSASPPYFLPIDISGILYGDGKIGWNNPTSEAIKEASCIWPGRPIACVVSVGTGLEDAAQLAAQSKASSIAKDNPKQAFELDVAEYCVKCVTNSERIHGQVASSLSEYGIDGPWQYVRLNVPQGMAKIGLQEWEKFSMIAALTVDYMEDFDVQELKKEVADRLSSPAYYAVPASSSASGSWTGRAGVIRYLPQRQIEARGSRVTSVEMESDFIPNIRGQHGGRSEAFARQRLIASPQQESLEHSSDESGFRGIGGQKPLITDPSFGQGVTVSTKRERVGDSSAPSLPVDVYSFQDVPRTPQYEYDEIHSDDDWTSEIEFGGDELSAIVLCCDHPQCRWMGALQKDYLRDHYINCHDEYLIKPSTIVPPTTSRTRSRSWRCSGCLRKLTAENQGRVCDYCQRAYEAAETAATARQSDAISRLDGTDTSQPLILSPGPASSREDSLTNDESSVSTPKGAEGSPPPQSSIWIPPEVPEHWTSHTPSALGRINANTGFSRTRPFSAYKNIHTASASMRKAREEHRRQRLH